MSFETENQSEGKITEPKPLRALVGIGEGKLQEKRLPAIEVANSVVWVNPDIDLPFKLKEGERTDLAKFFTANPEATQKTSSLRAHASHKRAALLGRVAIKDREGNQWRDVDTKGTGYLYANQHTPLGVRDPRDPHAGLDSSQTPGIARMEDAIWDRDKTELFLRNGIRTYRIAAIIKLEEIVDVDGTKVSIEEAKKRQMLREDDVPVQELRVYGTRARLSQIWDRPHEAQVQDAMAIVSQEFGIHFKDEKEYLSWFADTLGEQLAKIHNLGYVHNFVTQHNITLDCRIIDLDSVEERQVIGEQEFEKKEGKDLKKAQESLMRYVGDVFKLVIQGPQMEAALAQPAFLDTFRKAYDRTRDAVA
jgi:hypothetical protein